MKSANEEQIIRSFDLIVRPALSWATLLTRISHTKIASICVHLKNTKFYYRLFCLTYNTNDIKIIYENRQKQILLVCCARVAGVGTALHRIPLIDSANKSLPKLAINLSLLYSPC